VTKDLRIFEFLHKIVVVLLNSSIRSEKISKSVEDLFSKFVSLKKTLSTISLLAFDIYYKAQTILMVGWYNF